MHYVKFLSGNLSFIWEVKFKILLDLRKYLLEGDLEVSLCPIYFSLSCFHESFSKGWHPEEQSQTNN